jgi:hypothetical protein
MVKKKEAVAPISISNVDIDMTDEADVQLAIAAGKLADALAIIATRGASKTSYGIFIQGNS